MREIADAENARQQRSNLESILNVARRLRLRCFHRLRPCWTNVLSILPGVLSYYFLRSINILLSRNGFYPAS